MERSDLSTRKSRLDQERLTLSKRIAHLQRRESQQQVKDQVMDESHLILRCNPSSP